MGPRPAADSTVSAHIRSIHSPLTAFCFSVWSTAPVSDAWGGGRFLGPGFLISIVCCRISAQIGPLIFSSICFWVSLHAVADAWGFSFLWPNPHRTPDAMRMQIGTFFLWCCLCAVWTPPFTLIGPICLRRIVHRVLRPVWIGPLRLLQNHAVFSKSTQNRFSWVGSVGYTDHPSPNGLHPHIYCNLFLSLGYRFTDARGLLRPGLADVMDVLGRAVHSGASYGCESPCRRCCRCDHGQKTPKPAIVMCTLVRCHTKDTQCSSCDAGAAWTLIRALVLFHQWRFFLHRLFSEDFDFEVEKKVLPALMKWRLLVVTFPFQSKILDPDLLQRTRDAAVKHDSLIVLLHCGAVKAKTRSSGDGTNVCVLHFCGSCFWGGERRVEF